MSQFQSKISISKTVVHATYLKLKSTLRYTRVESFKDVSMVHLYRKKYSVHSRAVARSENPGGLVVLGGDNVSPPGRDRVN